VFALEFCGHKWIILTLIPFSPNYLKVFIGADVKWAVVIHFLSIQTTGEITITAKLDCLAYHDPPIILSDYRYNYSDACICDA